MTQTWDSLIRTLGLTGDDWVFPPEAKRRITKFAKSPLEKVIEKLRSGEDMPASAAAILADVIEGRYLYKLELIAVGKNIRHAQIGANRIGIGLEIERLMRDEGVTVSRAVAVLAGYLGVDERTIWRNWRDYKGSYPNGYLELFESMNKPAEDELRKKILDLVRSTDKK